MVSSVGPGGRQIWCSAGRGRRGGGGVLVAAFCAPAPLSWSRGACTEAGGCCPRSGGQRLLRRLRFRLCSFSSLCGGEGRACGARDVFPADVLEPDLSSRPWWRAYMRYSKPSMATAFAGRFPSGAAAGMRWWCTVESCSALETTAFAHRDPRGLRCNFPFPRVFSAKVCGQLCWMIPGEGCVYDVCVSFV